MPKKIKLQKTSKKTISNIKNKLIVLLLIIFGVVFVLFGYEGITNTLTLNSQAGNQKKLCGERCNASGECISYMYDMLNGKKRTFKTTCSSIGTEGNPNQKTEKICVPQWIVELGFFPSTSYGKTLESYCAENITYPGTRTQQNNNRGNKGLPVYLRDCITDSTCTSSLDCVSYTNQKGNKYNCKRTPAGRFCCPVNRLW